MANKLNEEVSNKLDFKEQMKYYFEYYSYKRMRELLSEKPQEIEINGIGKYETLKMSDGKTNLKILFVGGFHSCFPEEHNCERTLIDCVKKNECVIRTNFKTTFETLYAIYDFMYLRNGNGNNLQSNINYKFHAPTVYMLSSFYAFFNKFKGEFSGVEELLRGDPKSLWKYVTFTNFIQRYVKGRDFIVDHNLIDVDYCYGYAGDPNKLESYKKLYRNIFIKTVNEVNPDVIVVLTYKEIVQQIKRCRDSFIKEYHLLNNLSEENIFYVFSEVNNRFHTLNSDAVQSFTQNCFETIVETLSKDVVKNDLHFILAAIWAALIIKRFCSRFPKNYLGQIKIIHFDEITNQSLQKLVFDKLDSYETLKKQYQSLQNHTDRGKAFKYFSILKDRFNLSNEFHEKQIYT